jgi:hypothetical protein
MDDRSCAKARTSSWRRSPDPLARPTPQQTCLLPAGLADLLKTSLFFCFNFCALSQSFAEQTFSIPAQDDSLKQLHSISFLDHSCVCFSLNMSLKEFSGGMLGWVFVCAFCAMPYGQTETENCQVYPLTESYFIFIFLLFS